MRKSIKTLALTLVSSAAICQIQVDNSLILTGALPSDRQVHGLENPSENSALASAIAVQENSSRFAIAQGINDLTAQFQPAPGTLSIGSAYFIMISNNNTGPATLEVNNLGSYSIMKNVIEELVENDLKIGQIAYVVFDGNAFQLISERNVGKRDCPLGFVEVNSMYCIEAEERDTLDFYDAAQTCGDAGGRLCTWGEWFWACRDTTLVLNDMVGNSEWTNTTANGDFLARIVGTHSCYTAATSEAGATPRNYRCCYTR